MELLSVGLLVESSAYSMDKMWAEWRVDWMGDKTAALMARNLGLQRASSMAATWVHLMVEMSAGSMVEY